MDRRGFIRTTCMGCAGLTLGGLALGGCAPALPLVRADGKDRLVRIPITSFGEGTLVIVRSPRLPQDILVRKLTDGSYASVYLMCSHQEQPITATTTELHCPSHGSRFDMNGQVLTGPAAASLKTFPVTVEANELLIDLNPGLRRD
jgi:nitrite reductase/ring-hydroxylating ferredoxin subunit